MNTQRQNQITFRLSDAENTRLKEKIYQSGLNQQEYLRRAALGKEITNTEGIRELYPEMKRQGTNLNQVAKRLNERGYVDYDGELKTTLQGVRETWQLLRQYLHMHQ